MNTKALTLVGFGLVAFGCSSSNITTGQRADGLTVECEEDSYEIFECTPDDDDDECEGWEDGGPAFVLWPPNHKLHQIDLADCIDLYSSCTDDDDPNDPNDPDADVWRITALTADEAIDVGRGGDGNTADYDMAILDETSVEVRAERQGGGDGRVYQVEIENLLDDAFSCEIHVPHNRGPHGGAIDSGVAERIEL